MTNVNDYKPSCLLITLGLYMVAKFRGIMMLNQGSL